MREPRKCDQLSKDKKTKNNPEMTKILELSDKNNKAATILCLKKIYLNEEKWSYQQRIKTTKKNQIKNFKLKNITYYKSH